MEALYIVYSVPAFLESGLYDRDRNMAPNPFKGKLLTETNKRCLASWFASMFSGSLHMNLPYIWMTSRT